jgi:hypothetical protein
MAAVLDGDGPPPAQPPRLARVRPASGALTRVGAYLLMAFVAVVVAPTVDPSRALPWIELARAVCRDPDPGLVGPTLERIDGLLAGAEQLIATPVGDPRLAIGLIHAAATIAATEPVAG